MSSIQQISIDTKIRKSNAAKRCLTSQLGERLRLSERPAVGEYQYNTRQHERISKIEESIFKDDRNNGEEKTLN